MAVGFIIEFKTFIYVLSYLHAGFASIRFLLLVEPVKRGKLAFDFTGRSEIKIFHINRCFE